MKRRSPSPWSAGTCSSRGGCAGTATSPTLTISESSRASLLHYGLRHVGIVPVGIDDPVPSEPVSKARRPTLIFCGRLVPSKRPADALAAFAIVREQLPDPRLLVVGSGPLEAELRDQAPPGTEILGRVSDHEKRRLMARSHLPPRHVGT